MAVTATNLDVGQHSGSTSSQATSSVSPAANTLILVSVINDSTGGGGGSPAATPTISGNSITWTQIATIHREDDHAYRITLFRGSSATPTSGTITIDFAGNNQGSIAWIVDQLSLVDLTNPVIQSATNGGTGITSLAVTLAAFSAAANATYGVVGGDGTIVITKGGNFTELANHASTTAIESQWANNNQTSVNWTMGSSNCVAIGVEIKATVQGGEFLFNLI